MAVLRSPTLGIRGVLAGLDLRQSKANTRRPNTSKCKVLLYLQPFGRNFNVNLWPPIRSPVWGVTVDLRVWKIVPIKISSPHSYLTIGLSCAVWPQYTTWQADRAMAIGRLCYSIGGLKIIICFCWCCQLARHRTGRHVADGGHRFRDWDYYWSSALVVSYATSHASLVTH